MTATDQGSSPPQSRTAYVLERLKRDLASGAIQPGESLKQTVIAKRYGVSPTPVREALRILEADGAVTYSPHRGATVREMTPTAAVDLYRLRAAVEGTAAQMAVERMTPEGLTQIEDQHRALVTALDDGVDPARLSMMNRELHFTIYAQSSPLVVQYLDLLWSRFTPSTTIWTKSHAEDLEEDHESIIDAIRAGQAEEAGRRMADHILRASRIRQEDPTTRAEGRDEHAHPA
jgi:DNA-binding GntR family transcriptional regulator